MAAETDLEFTLRLLREAKPFALRDGFGIRLPVPTVAQGLEATNQARGIGGDVLSTLPNRIEDWPPEILGSGGDEESSVPPEPGGDSGTPTNYRVVTVVAGVPTATTVTINTP